MIFVDTSFWVAARLRDDDRHANAVALLERNHRERLVTSNHVRGETWTFLLRGAGTRLRLPFLDALERTARADVRVVAAELEEEALQCSVGPTNAGTPSSTRRASR